MGFRTKARESDLSEILPEEIEAAVKAAAEISMGTEITEEDLEATSALAEQVVDLTEHRQSLGSYLSNRMQALAPNLTALVGELVGARLIAHAGSLMNLAKSPGSTIQILGAEKALFRALKTKHDTPKYGVCTPLQKHVLFVLKFPAHLPRIPYWSGHWKEQGQDRSYARCQVRLGSPR
jgi:nucleolar protein 58